jgi:hypothetical protein
MLRFTGVQIVFTVFLAILFLAGPVLGAPKKADLMGKWEVEGSDTFGIYKGTLSISSAGRSKVRLFATLRYADGRDRSWVASGRYRRGRISCSFSLSPIGIARRLVGAEGSGVTVRGSYTPSADGRRMKGQLSGQDFSGGEILIRLRTAGGARGRRRSRAAARTEARITGLSSPCTTSTGLIDFAWDRSGDAIPFELTVEVDGDPKKVKAELWTNANNNANPSRYDARPMKLIRVNGKTATYRIDLPIYRLGNYRATARISVDGGRSYRYAGDRGIADLRFRPRDESHDALNFMEVNIGSVNFDAKTGRYGTFADMMESGSPETNGKYTLEWLANQGKTAIWLQPPFEINKWEHRHPLDDAGSPYAVNDYFSIRTELSGSARGLTGEAAREAALEEFRAFVKKAHSLGIKVILDVALNHVGHNYVFRDLFVRYDGDGEEIREVRKNDFSNVAPRPGRLGEIRKRLKDAKLPKYMEYLAPWMYGSRFGDPHGAKSVHEKIAGGWGEWPDTAQLNHGAGPHGRPMAETPENRAVRGWLGRILRFWAVDMDCDGFRLDHLTGLPLGFVEEGLNLAQGDVDRHHPGKNLFVMGEDFHNVDNTRHFLDSIQGGWFRELVKVRTPADLERITQSPWFTRNLVNLSSHDEARFINHFGANYRAATRLSCLLELIGGPVTEVAGDHFGERQKLLFKQYKGLPALKNLDAVKKEIASTYARTGRARKTLAALRDDNRAFLRPKVGGPDPDLVALSRWPDAGKDSEPVFIFANLNDDRTRENAFRLGNESRSRINPARRYVVRDLMADDPSQTLWDPPLTGREILDEGIFARLRPYQIQVLKLKAVE